MIQLRNRQLFHTIHLMTNDDIGNERASNEDSHMTNSALCLLNCPVLINVALSKKRIFCKNKSFIIASYIHSKNITQCSQLVSKNS